MSNPEIMSIINTVLQNFDPTKEDDQEAAVFASTFNHFEKKGRRHRNVVKTVPENYFVDLEKREKLEAERRGVEATRLKNNEMLKQRFQ